MEQQKRRLTKWLGLLVTLAFTPLVINVMSNLPTWFGTRDKVEVTFKLESWITIGSVKLGDLSDLQLTYRTEPVDNVLKVSWIIANTGSRGIERFESGPSIQFPRGLNMVLVKVSDTSTLCSRWTGISLRPMVRLR